MKKALVTYGGWEGHQPKETAEIFIEVLKKGNYDVVVSDSLSCYTDEKLLKSLDLIIHNWTMAHITPEQEKGLVETVKNGTGLAGWHGGLGDSLRNITIFQFMVGDQFVDHPGGGVEYEVNIIKKNDPIVKGINDFLIKSEQYYMHVDPTNEVLATTTFKGNFMEKNFPWINGCVMPVAWKRMWGKGRVFYSSLGHNTNDFNIPEVKEIMKRGMFWASR